ELRFSDVEKRLAAFMLCYQQVYDFKTFVDVLSGDKEANYTALVARMINADKEEVARALLPSAALASSGILVDPDTLEGHEYDFYDAFGWYVLDKDLIKSLEKNNVEFHDIVKEIIGEVTLSNRSW